MASSAETKTTEYGRHSRPRAQPCLVSIMKDLKGEAGMNFLNTVSYSTLLIVAANLVR